MSDADASSSGAIFRKLPEYWKIIAVILAIAAAAVGGSRWVDAQLGKPEERLGGRITALNARLSGLEERVATVEREKAPLSGLDRFDDLDALMAQTCGLRLQLQKMEHKALKGAYDELLRTLDSAKDLYLKLNRELTQTELLQVTEISKRRSDVATKREHAEQEIATLDARVLSNTGCDG